jgi:transcriptional regulator with XRE-family HTH domain
MNLSSRGSLISRLHRGKRTREQFVDSHLARTVAHQIRAMRDEADWSQDELGEKIGSNQNAIYRYELPDYGKHTLSTLKRIAAAFDVALVVRFVPFSELVDWVSGTPRLERGLRNSALKVPPFGKDFNRERPAQERSSASAIQQSGVVLRDVSLQTAKAESAEMNGVPTELVRVQEDHSSTQYLRGRAS